MDVYPGIIKQPDVWKARLKNAMPAVKRAEDFGLQPTPYFVEALGYWHRAHALQQMNLGLKRHGPVGDKLQEAIPIYDTVKRRYAGFSNVLEQLFYGFCSPKIIRNTQMHWNYPHFKGPPKDFMYVCLVHRCTGSGASFEWDHGWRNTIVPQMAALGRIPKMSQFVKTHPGPSGTSIGNQYPAVRVQADLQGARNHLQYYLANEGVELVTLMYEWLKANRRPTVPVGIKDAVDKSLEINASLGQKRFVFVLTAWVMDIAEYFSYFVDPNSDCYHGSNARQSWERLFVGSGQKLYDKAARFMATETNTWPMDIEDVACDAVRWIESYVPKRGYQHVLDQGIYSSCSLVHDRGRQA